MNPDRSHNSGFRLKPVFMEPARGPTEIMVAIYMLAFSLPLFTIKNLAQYPTYAQMNRMAPGYLWGAGLALIAIVRVFCVLKGSYWGRLGTTAASIFSWSLLFVSFALAQKWHPGVTVFAWWMVAETWTLFRIPK